MFETVYQSVGLLQKILINLGMRDFESLFPNVLQYQVVVDLHEGYGINLGLKTKKVAYLQLGNVHGKVQMILVDATLDVNAGTISHRMIPERGHFHQILFAPERLGVNEQDGLVDINGNVLLLNWVQP